MSIPNLPSTPAVTSAQNATTAAVDLPTSEALANALKVTANAEQVDIAAIHTWIVGAAATINALQAEVATLSTEGVGGDEGQGSITSQPTYTGDPDTADGGGLGPSVVDGG